MVCPYCGYDVEDTGVCPRCGTLRGDIALTGWRPDPTARHEGRYYVAGRPTNRVRDGKAETADHVGGQILPEYVEILSSGRASIRSAWLGSGVATVVIVVLSAVIWVLLMPGNTSPSPDATYLSALKDSGLAGEFNSDANAVAHAKEVCRELEHGGPQQGRPVDKYAVDAFCPQFSTGFHILETATVSGAFMLADTSPVTGISSIASDGTSCEGTDGYADIGPDTQVIVKNGKNEILTTTALGQGHGGNVTCTFSFSFPVTEGQDRYVVSVGRRGEFSYSFAQLRNQGVKIRLGH